MANIKIISEHSVDIDLLTGGICIDVGCRGFAFSEAMRDLGCDVKAFDLEDMNVPVGIDFFKKAISNKSGVSSYTNTKDAQAKYLNHLITGEGIPCDIWGINDLYKIICGEVDILKLDCEGSEYIILSDLEFQPKPRQLSIEFHMHCHRALHDQYYNKCMENLLKYYIPVQHVLTEAHGAGWNYWNSLFVRKDLMP